MNYQVRFLPDNTEVLVEEGTTLLNAANMAGIQIKSSCGGAGSCGNCKVILDSGETVLACKTEIVSDMTVTVPPESRLTEHKVLVDTQSGPEAILQDFEFDPLVRKVQLTLSEPTLDDITSDLSRLVLELKKKLNLGEITARDIELNLSAYTQLGQLLRENNWQVTVTLVELENKLEILNIEGGHNATPPYGVALDIGTTTLAAYLIDLSNGQIIDRQGTYNKQAQFGDDVINRIIYTDDHPGGLEEMQKVVVSAVNKLIGEMLKKNSLSFEDVSIMVAAGNTTMTHLFLGVSPKYLRLEPYIPAITCVPPVKAKDLRLQMNPEGYVLMYPSVASYVGGDIVSGVMLTGIDKKEELNLFIDIGTNGEMVLGNQDWMVTCACSAGPSFEGGGITFGMRAMSGAIEKVEIDPQTLDVELSVIGNVPPIGICGSGLIDLMAKMRKVGIIDRTGKFIEDMANKRIRINEGEPEYVLAFSEQSGNGKDIVITESDIKNLIRSKGAVYAGIRSLLNMVQLTEEAIDTIIIAGGFGNYLNIEDAIEIGLLPDLPREKYQFVGNSSLKGTHLALISRQAYKAMTEVSRKMTYMELSVGNVFMDEYVSSLFLPHTDLSLFPSIVA